ncbi:MFS transporter [Terrarubrum flagellatum]|uniref:MFS transporter n=1 Tax=Terrirubrum flagellatum TaxID=2895980 RepID=UPI003144E1B6
MDDRSEPVVEAAPTDDDLVSDLEARTDDLPHILAESDWRSPLAEPVAASAAPEEAERSQPILIALIVSCAFLMQGIDSTMLTTAIPTMAREMNVSPLALHFAVTGYLVSLAVFMPVSGWFADRFGARRVFCGAIVIFTLGSTLCGASNSLPMLVAARIVQGFGGALMTPVGRLIVLRAFGPGKTLDAMTYLTLPTLLGPLCGPLMGAAIVTYAPWQWIFYVNVPVCALAIAAALAVIEKNPPGAPDPFDFSGFLIVGAGFLLVQLGVENLAHPFLAQVWTAIAIMVAIIIALLYRRHAARREDPAFDLSLFSNANYSIGVIGGGIGRIGLNSASFLLPLMLQIGFGLSPIASGLYTLTSALGSLGSKSMLQAIIIRLGFKALLVALVCLGSALLASLAFVDRSAPMALLVGLVVLLSMIRTMHFNSVNTLTYSDVPPEKLSRAVSSAGVIQQLAMGFGVSAGSATLAFVAADGHHLTLPDFSVAFLVMAIVPLLSLPILFAIPKRTEIA